MPSVSWRGGGEGGRRGKVGKGESGRRRVEDLPPGCRRLGSNNILCRMKRKSKIKTTEEAEQNIKSLDTFNSIGIIIDIIIN